MNKHLFFVFIFTLLTARAYPYSPDDKLKIFVDCQAFCDLPYLKQHLEGVEFVRDRHDADVYVLITAQPNGSGGRTFYVDFEGQGTFEDVKDRVIFQTSPDTQTDELVKNCSKPFAWD